jgi:tRNA pseudouridine38-40 synthase
VQRYFIQLSYKGTNYHGWQVQANALSIQEVVDKALSSILRHQAPTLGCGRTDTGVHALDFYAHFDSGAVQTLLDPDFIYHLNCMLPWDIAAKQLLKVHPDAHARFDALSRTYEYRIAFRKDPFLKDRAMLCRNNLDVPAMQQAAQILLEYSDFGCFSKNLTQVKTNLCKIMLAEWSGKEDGLVFRIQADRFLRNMVRAIVGTLLDIGRGKINEAGLRKIIEGGNRSDAGTSVPAGGLYLCEIVYPKEVFIP